MYFTGLQGRNNSKSKERGAKRAQRNHKLVAKDSLIIGKKKELIFNDASRTDYLTGFHKRKQQRRMYGLTMQVLKEKKAQIEVRKQRRKAVASETQAHENDEDEDLERDSSNKEQQSFNDEDTRAMFGGEVSVVIDTGVADALDEIAHPEQSKNSASSGRKNNVKRTRFDAAAEKAKEMMKHKPGRAGGKNRLRRSDKTQLLHKALGAGALGANVYKGKMKKRKSHHGH